MDRLLRWPAEELVDIEAMPTEGSDNAVYGYVFDFEGAAFSDMQIKLMAKYETLQV